MLELDKMTGIDLKGKGREGRKEKVYTPLVEEFINWFHSRGEFYAKLQVKFYKDGEPYFYSHGAECTLRDYLRVKNGNAR
jgi:hypothetical protein